MPPNNFNKFQHKQINQAGLGSLSLRHAKRFTIQITAFEGVSSKNLTFIASLAAQIFVMFNWRLGMRFQRVEMVECHQ